MSSFSFINFADSSFNLLISLINSLFLSVNSFILFFLLLSSLKSLSFNIFICSINFCFWFNSNSFSFVNFSIFSLYNSLSFLIFFKSSFNLSNFSFNISYSSLIIFIFLFLSSFNFNSLIFDSFKFLISFCNFEISSFNLLFFSFFNSSSFL